MKRSQLVEIVGVTAVVLSLLFVGMELRQNTAALSAQALAELNLASNTALYITAENEELAALDVRGRSGVEDFTEVELERYLSNWQAGFNTFEAAYLFYQKGIISEQDYETWRRGACASYRLPDIQQLLAANGFSLNDEFVAELERCDDQ